MLQDITSHYVSAQMTAIVRIVRALNPGGQVMFMDALKCHYFRCLFALDFPLEIFNQFCRFQISCQEVFTAFLGLLIIFGHLMNCYELL